MDKSKLCSIILGLMLFPHSVLATPTSTDKLNTAKMLIIAKDAGVYTRGTISIKVVGEPMKFIGQSDTRFPKIYDPAIIELPNVIQDNWTCAYGLQISDWSDYEDPGWLFSVVCIPIINLKISVSTKIICPASNANKRLMFSSIILDVAGVWVQLAVSCQSFMATVPS